MTPLRHSLAICEEYLATLAPVKKEGGGFAVVRAELRRNGWLFYYQSIAFLESGNWLDALGGNQPLLVTGDDEVKVIAFGQDLEEIAGAQKFTP